MSVVPGFSQHGSGSQPPGAVIILFPARPDAQSRLRPGVRPEAGRGTVQRTVGRTVGVGSATRPRAPMRLTRRGRVVVAVLVAVLAAGLTAVPLVVLVTASR
ncbi:MAG TPA: hypothetical protein VIS06_03480 [Mycobacteriales bacterium]